MNCKSWTFWNSIDVWNFRLELRGNLRQGVKDMFRKAPDRATGWVKAQVNTVQNVY